MSASEALVIIARWQVGVESLGALLALVAELRQRSLEEPGCLGYEVLRSDEPPAAGQPHELVLLERYRDVAALEAHRGSPHYRELLVTQILPLLSARRVEVLRLEGA